MESKCPICKKSNWESEFWRDDVGIVEYYAQCTHCGFVEHYSYGGHEFDKPKKLWHRIKFYFFIKRRNKVWKD